MDWHDMKPFHNGQDDEGREKFFVPLPNDEDGMVGRECSKEECQPRYFKIDPRKGDSSESEINDKEKKTEIVDLYCPYCGHLDNIQQFITKDQLEWMQSMIMRDMARTVEDAIGSAFKSIKPIKNSMFSFSLNYKPGSLPSVRHYAEKKLKRIVNCDECGLRYAVYGIALYCPSCGKGNLHIHLRRSIETIEALINFGAEIESQSGKEIVHQLLGNCLEDCVSLFEGFLKVIYYYGLLKTSQKEIIDQRIFELKNSFQNLKRAENIVRSDLNMELLIGIASSDREFMEIEFAKRHVITHNLGLIDEKFKSQIATWQQSGQDIEIKSDDLNKLLKLIEQILQNAINILKK